MDPQAVNYPTIIDENPLPFKINVKLLSNEVYDFEVSKHMLVLDFKHHIAPTVKVPV